jgi:hypothetical protein
MEWFKRKMDPWIGVKGRKDKWNGVKGRRINGLVYSKKERMHGMVLKGVGSMEWSKREKDQWNGVEGRRINGIV